MSRGVRAELRGLSPELAEIVGAHMVMAGRLLATDPALAYRHADAARRRASRLPVTREATAETAYAAGEWAIALNEYRALRRMNGGNEFVAAMADCERALGRPQAALKLLKEALDASPKTNDRIELRLVEAGSRQDLGQMDEALRVLKTEIEVSSGKGSRQARANLRYGYAAMLEASGDPGQAEKWFVAAAALDDDGETDAQERAEALQGFKLEVDEDAFDDEEDSDEDDS
ncbi:MAG TPA: hypothetical protein DEG88_13090, partial [Propionibacteriaceae bacterium]|nr:hypothetical protein [Propionibacteriaceae bacterium]